MRTEQISPRYVELDSWSAAEMIAAMYEGQLAAAAAVREAGTAHSEEFVLADLQEARLLLESVTGQRSSGDMLVHIFERFCVGK